MRDVVPGEQFKTAPRVRAEVRNSSQHHPRRPYLASRSNARLASGRSSCNTANRPPTDGRAFPKSGLPAERYLCPDDGNERSFHRLEVDPPYWTPTQRASRGLAPDDRSFDLVPCSLSVVRQHCFLHLRL